MPQKRVADWLQTWLALSPFCHHFHQTNVHYRIFPYGCQEEKFKEFGKKREFWRCFIIFVEIRRVPWRFKQVFPKKSENWFPWFLPSAVYHFFLFYNNLYKILSTDLCKTENTGNCPLTDAGRCDRMNPCSVRCTVALLCTNPNRPDFWNTLQRLVMPAMNISQNMEEKGRSSLHVLTESTCHWL